MKKIVSVITAYMLLSFIIASTTSAQVKDTVNSLFQLSLEDLVNVVITPSKLPQLAGNITQKIDIVNSRDIKSTIFSNRNLSEAIAGLPGSSVCALSRNDANWGTYGGIGPKYSTYMLQGLPIDAFIDPMSLDANAIGHIEVQRGPASVIYPNYLSQDFAGNQTPLAGTVNLILIEKVEQTKTMVQSSYGSFNTLNGQIFHQNRIGGLSFFCGSTYEMSDYTNYGTSNSWLNMKKNPEYKKTKIYGGLTYFIDENEKQKLTFFYQGTWNTGDAGRVYRGFDNLYETANIGYDVELDTSFHLQSHMGMRSYNRTWEESNFGLTDTLKSNNTVNQKIIPFDISLYWKHGETDMLSIGADYQGASYYTSTDLLKGYTSYGNKSSAVQKGIYAQEEWRPFSQITFRAGLRYAYIKNQIELVNGSAPGISNVWWEHLLWSAGVKYLLNDVVSLYANGGSSFGTPGLKSSGGTIPLNDMGIAGRNGQLPNPDLKPEKGLGADAGMELRFLPNIKVSIRTFYTIVDDAIVDKVVSRNPSQTQSINSGSAKSAGGEIEIAHQLSFSFSWFVNGTYMSTNNKNDLSPDENDVEIPFSPQFVANMGMKYYSPGGFTLVMTLNYNDGFYDGISKTGRNWFKPGFIINAYAAQNIAAFDAYDVECFAQLSNITNNKYEMPWQFQNTGFAGMFGIRVTF
jgi:iron complex outermembrane recepter protein